MVFHGYSEAVESRRRITLCYSAYCNDCCEVSLRTFCIRTNSLSVLEPSVQEVNFTVEKRRPLFSSASKTICFLSRAPIYTDQTAKLAYSLQVQSVTAHNVSRS